MEARAIAKFVIFAPNKVRRFCRLVKGRKVPEARALLSVQSSPAAASLAKVIASAAANAEDRLGADKDELTVTAAYADDGMRYRRMLPRARGRADMTRKRTCHITVVVSDEE